MNTHNPLVFDKKLYMMRKQRASKNLSKHDFIFSHNAMLLAERISEDFHFRLFDNALVYSVSDIKLSNAQKIMRAALCKAEGIEICYDEELLPDFAVKFDLAVSNLSLHCVNDLPGALIQYRNVLNADGIFIASIFGGETLKELRKTLLDADIKLYNSAAPRVIPFVDVKSAAMLLKRAGFKQSVADTYSITIQYNSLLSLLQDIKGMGEANCLHNRSLRPVSKKYFTYAADKYPTISENCINATVEIITMVGWK